MLFAFLTHQCKHVTALQILHAFTFQLLSVRLSEHSDLWPVLDRAYTTKSQELVSSIEYAQAFLVDILRAVELTYIVIDGIDEIDEAERKVLLKIVLQLAAENANVKLLVSSREEVDIGREMKHVAKRLSIGSKNNSDIEDYVTGVIQEWLTNLRTEASNLHLGIIEQEIRNLIRPIAAKAQGMLAFVDNLETLSIQNAERSCRDVPVCQISITSLAITAKSRGP